MAPLDIVDSISVGSRRRRNPLHSTFKTSLADLENWLAVAAPGDVLAYHRGFLAMDRSVGSRLGEDDRKKLGRVADAAMILAKSGYVHLVQRRHGPDDYTYLAIASSSLRRSPGPKPMLEAAS